MNTPVDHTTLPDSLWKGLQDALLNTINAENFAPVVKQLPQAVQISISQVDRTIEFKVPDLWKVCVEKGAVHNLFDTLDPTNEKRAVRALRTEYDRCQAFVDMSVKSYPYFYKGLGQLEAFFKSVDDITNVCSKWLTKLDAEFGLPKSVELKPEHPIDCLLELSQFRPADGKNADLFFSLSYGIIIQSAESLERDQSLGFLKSVAAGKKFNEAEINAMQSTIVKLNKVVVPTTAATAQPSIQPVWLIMAEPGNGNIYGEPLNTFTITLWKWNPWSSETTKHSAIVSGYSHFGEAENCGKTPAVPLAEVRKAVADLIQTNVNLNSGNPYLEFMVPVDLMHLDFDQIPIKFEVIPGFQEESPLGVLARVSIRSLDRSNPKNRNTLLAQWVRRSANLHKSVLHTRFLDKETEHIHAFISEVPNGNEHSFVVRYGHYPTTNYRKLLTGLLVSGIPVSIWLRKGENCAVCKRCANCLPSARVKTKLTTLVTGANVEELQERVLSLRAAAVNANARQAHEGRCLTLLLEDPSRLWPHIAERESDNSAQASPAGHIDPETLSNLSRN